MSIAAIVTWPAVYQPEQVSAYLPVSMRPNASIVPVIGLNESTPLAKFPTSFGWPSAGVTQLGSAMSTHIPPTTGTHPGMSNRPVGSVRFTGSFDA